MPRKLKRPLWVDFLRLLTSQREGPCFRSLGWYGCLPMSSKPDRTKAVGQLNGQFNLLDYTSLRNHFRTNGMRCHDVAPEQLTTYQFSEPFQDFTHIISSLPRACVLK
jgi:hypothetical protein